MAYDAIPHTFSKVDESYETRPMQGYLLEPANNLSTFKFFVPPTATEIRFRIHRNWPSNENNMIAAIRLNESPNIEYNQLPDFYDINSYPIKYDELKGQDALIRNQQSLILNLVLDYEPNVSSQGDWVYVHFFDRDSGDPMDLYFLTVNYTVNTAEYMKNYPYVNLDNVENIDTPSYTPDEPTELTDNYEGNEQHDEGEPDWNRLGRNQKIVRTIVSYKQDNRDLDIPISFGIDSWSEPKPYYNAFYPENKVFYTHHGLLIELDDTIDNRRIHIYHPSNTYIEINEDGNVVFRNSGSRYDIIDESLFKLVKGNYYKTISGTYSRLIEGEELTQISKDKIQTVEKDDVLRVNNNKYEQVEGDDNSFSKKNRFISSDISTHINGGAAVNIDGETININCGDTELATMESDIDLESIRRKLQPSNRWWNEI